MLLNGLIIPIVLASQSQIFKAVSLLRDFSQKDYVILRQVVGKCRFSDIDLGNFPKLGQFFFYPDFSRKIKKKIKMKIKKIKKEIKIKNFSFSNKNWNKKN